MSLHQTFYLMVILILGLVSVPALAINNWTICRYEFKTVNVNKAQREITVNTTKTLNSAGDCVTNNQTLTFRPETMDYQNELPFKYFPKVGEKRILVYRYIDGECKDRGPCRIKHYSINKK